MFLSTRDVDKGQTLRLRAEAVIIVQARPTGAAITVSGGDRFEVTDDAERLGQRLSLPMLTDQGGDAVWVREAAVVAIAPTDGGSVVHLDGVPSLAVRETPVEVIARLEAPQRARFEAEQQQITG